MVYVPEQDLSILQTLRYSLTLWKKAFPKVFLLALFVACINVLPHTIHPEGAGALVYHLPSETQWQLWIFIFLQFFISIVFYGAMYHQTMAVMGAKNVSILDSVKRSFVKSPKLILGSLLFSVILIVGLALLMLPGLFFLVALYFFIPLIMLDEGGIWINFVLSFRLVVPYWWRSAIFIIGGTAVTLAIYVLATDLGLPLFKLQHAGGIPWSVGAMLAMIIVLTVMVPWLLSLFTVHIYDLLNRHDHDYAEHLRAEA